MEYHSASKRNEALEKLYNMDSEDTTLSEKTQTQRPTVRDSIYMKRLGRVNPETESGLVVARGWRGWAWGSQQRILAHSPLKKKKKTYAFKFEIQIPPFLFYLSSPDRVVANNCLPRWFLS